MMMMMMKRMMVICTKDEMLPNIYLNKKTQEMHKRYKLNKREYHAQTVPDKVTEGTEGLIYTRSRTECKQV